MLKINSEGYSLVIPLEKISELKKFICPDKCLEALGRYIKNQDSEFASNVTYADSYPVLVKRIKEFSKTTKKELELDVRKKKPVFNKIELVIIYKNTQCFLINKVLSPLKEKILIIPLSGEAYDQAKKNAA